MLTLLEETWTLISLTGLGENTLVNRQLTNTVKTVEGVTSVFTGSHTRETLTWTWGFREVSKRKFHVGRNPKNEKELARQGMGRKNTLDKGSGISKGPEVWENRPFKELEEGKE